MMQSSDEQSSFMGGRSLQGGASNQHMVLCMNSARSMIESSDLNDDSSILNDGGSNPIDDIQQSIMKAQKSMKNKLKKQRKKAKRQDIKQNGPFVLPDEPSNEVA
jgi:hypothetical protein